MTLAGARSSFISELMMWANATESLIKAYATEKKNNDVRRMLIVEIAKNKMLLFN